MYDPIDFSTSDWHQRRQEEDEAIRAVLNNPWIGQPYGWHQPQRYSYRPGHSNVIVTYEVHCGPQHRINILSVEHL